MPWEDYNEEANERGKYDELRELCVSKRWAKDAFQYRSGLKVFHLSPLIIISVGVEGKQSRTIVKNMSEAAKRA